jgi:hypothetical protein
MTTVSHATARAGPVEPAKLSALSRAPAPAAPGPASTPLPAPLSDRKAARPARHPVLLSVASKERPRPCRPATEG